VGKALSCADAFRHLINRISSRFAEAALKDEPSTEVELIRSTTLIHLRAQQRRSDCLCGLDGYLEIGVKGERGRTLGLAGRNGYPEK